MILVGLVLPGCSKEPSKFDREQSLGKYALQKLATNSKLSDEDRKLARDALINWDKGSQDKTPILVYANIPEAGADHPYILLAMADADCDICGFILTEERLSSESKQIVSTKYDIWRDKVVGSVSPVPITILPLTFPDSNTQSQVFGTDPNADINSGCLESDLVPIHLPDPGKVVVRVSVYDKKGHKSRSVLLTVYDKKEGR
jgi:hypothetical protein